MESCWFYKTFWETASFEKEVISHSTYFYASESTQSNASTWRVFYFIILLLSPHFFHKLVVLCIFMLGYNKWEYWSLAITKRVQCLWHHFNQHHSWKPVGQTILDMTWSFIKCNCIFKGQWQVKGHCQVSLITIRLDT